MPTDQLTSIIIAAMSAGGIGAVGAYLIARRRTSGQVGTTDADRLWTERREFSEIQRNEIKDLRERALLSDQRFFAVEQENRECGRRAEALETSLRAVQEVLAAKIETAKAEAKADVAERKQEIAELKQANGTAKEKA